MFPGETVASGAPSTCYECGEELKLRVCRSNSYYLGYWCDKDGPHSRETDYFSSKEEAEEAFAEYTETGYMENQRQ